MTRSLTTQDVSWFLDLNEKGQLNLNPPYQRRSVWSPRDKRYFVDTILSNHPAPPVFLHKTLDANGRATYHVVDGKQRLQTIIDFADNKIRIPDDFADINLQKKRFKELEKSTKESFWNYVLIVEMLPDVSDAAIRNTFERINRNSRKLSAQELRHAKYEGWFISFVESEAESPEWRTFGIATAARIKRMSDVQFISELCAVVLKNSIVGFDQDELDELYATYEDISEVGTFVEDDFRAEINRLKSLIVDLSNSRPGIKDFFKVQSHFYSLWAYLHLAKPDAGEVATLAERYEGFMNLVAKAINDPEEAQDAVDGKVTEAEKKAVLSYAANARGASTDHTPRLARHHALTTALTAPQGDHE